jgi:hypothetical protein
MAKGFLSRIMYNNWLWILGLLLLLLSFAYQTLAVEQLPGSSQSDFPLEVLPGLSGMVVAIRSFFSPLLLKNIFSLVILITGGILFQFFTSDNRLIRVRSFFPFFWYCVMGATLFPYVNQPVVYVAGVLLVGACFRIFSVTEKKKMNRALFDASLLIALSSLAFNRLLWMLPFFWLAAANVQPISFRNIVASLFGYASLYWLVGGISFLFDDYRYLHNAWHSVLTFELIDFSILTPAAVVYLAFMGLLLLIAFGSFVQQQNQDKLLTRNFLYAILILCLGGFAMWLTASSSNTAFLFLLGFPTLVFYAHFYSIRDHVFARILFFMHLMASIMAFFFFQ